MWETEQTPLHLYEHWCVYTFVFACKCMCVSVSIVCAREQMLCVCVAYVYVYMCVLLNNYSLVWDVSGRWRALAFIWGFHSTPVFGGAGGDVSVHSPWQTSVIKRLLRMLIYRTEICVCMWPATFCFQVVLLRFLKVPGWIYSLSSLKNLILPLAVELSICQLPGTRFYF